MDIACDDCGRSIDIENNTDLACMRCSVHSQFMSMWTLNWKVMLLRCRYTFGEANVFEFHSGYNPPRLTFLFKVLKNIVSVSFFVAVLKWMHSDLSGCQLNSVFEWHGSI